MWRLRSVNLVFLASAAVLGVQDEKTTSDLPPSFRGNFLEGIQPHVPSQQNYTKLLEKWVKNKNSSKIVFLDEDKNKLHVEDLAQTINTTDGPDIATKFPNGTTFRMSPFISNLSPSNDTVPEVNLIYYTKGSDGLQLSLNTESILEAGFDPMLPTKIITHGFLASPESPSVQRIKDAYLDTGKFNVLALDWQATANTINYFYARGQVEAVGDYFAQILHRFVQSKLIDPTKLHLIGHSLGAHVMGFVGKRAQKDGWRVNRITGLDPAGVLFDEDDELYRLDKGDADIVDIIHTCSDLLGMDKYIGHIDFYPNEGTKHQPGCNLLADMFGVCSHGRAPEYFAESVKTKDFVAKFCDTDREKGMLEAVACSGEPEAVMGDQLEYPAGGRYVLRTNAEPRFALGRDEEYPEALRGERIKRSSHKVLLLRKKREPLRSAKI